MSELITKAAEILSKGSEIRSSFDPDKKIRKNEIFNANEIKSKDTGYDPDKKVEKNSVDAEKPKEEYDPDKKIEKKVENSNEQKEVSQEEKDKIKEETGWSDEIIDAISSIEEYQIYKDAGLIEAEVDGRKCLINPNIDMKQKDVFGRTNKERMNQGLAPWDKNGNIIELHHIGQKNDAPLAELTQEQHRGKENNSILHDTKKESEIDRKAFDYEREKHWKTRAEGDNK